MQSNSENFQRLMEENGLTAKFEYMAIAELTFADGSKATIYQARSPADKIAVLEPDDQVPCPGPLQGREFIRRVNHAPTDGDMAIVHGAMLAAWERIQEVGGIRHD